MTPERLAPLAPALRAAALAGVRCHGGLRWARALAGTFFAAAAALLASVLFNWGLLAWNLGEIGLYSLSASAAAGGRRLVQARGL